MICEVSDCQRPSEDGRTICFPHKIKTVSLATAGLERERNGVDVTNGMGTERYVKDMYAKARAEGKPDPLPMNKEAARYAPAAGTAKGKKYKAANNGL